MRRTAKLHEDVEERLLMLLVQHCVAPQLLGLWHLVEVRVWVRVRVRVRVAAARPRSPG